MDIEKFNNIINQSPEKIEEYLTLDNIRADKLTNNQILELIKATKNIDKYITQPGEVRDLLSEFNIVELIISEGKSEEYLSHPERLAFYDKLKSKNTLNDGPLASWSRRTYKNRCLNEINKLIKATGNIEKYLTPEIIADFELDSSNIADLIKATGNIEKYLTPEIIPDFKLDSYHIADLIRETGNIEKYLTPEIIPDFKLSSSDIANLIRETGNIEEYLTPEIVANFELDSYHIADLIRETGSAEKYLTPEIIATFGFNSFDITKLIKETGNIEKYLTPEIIADFKIDSYDIADLIKATGNVEKYLTPEIIADFKIDSYYISDLIKSTENIEKYLFEGQTEYSYLTIANVIKTTGNIKKYLTSEKVSSFKLTSSDIRNLIKSTKNIEEYLTPEIVANLNLTDFDIDDLIKSTGNIEKYLFEGESEDSYLSIANVIKATGNIEKYLLPETIANLRLDDFDITKLIRETGNIEKYLFEGQSEYSYLSIANVIKGLNLCPNLDDSEIKLFNNFDFEITNTVLNLDAEKQKYAVLLLQRLDKNNSAELRRIKIPIALQILEKGPEKYEETLTRIEEIYLTNNIPDVGKLYLVFQELHPNFLGLDDNKEDESYAEIPSLQNASSSERRHILFTNLLMCALESNNRNIRDYIEIIENGDKLYKDYIEGKLELESLDENDERIKILSKYSNILNTLYNVTSNGKRGETRENSGNLGKDLKELDELFKIDQIKSSLPDRLVRTFTFGSNIRTFERAKDIFETSRKNAHEKNITISKQGSIELKEGDFIKGIVSTEYFPSMLQRGILAKDFLGGNANSDCTPLDTDVEKITSIKESFSETLNSLSIADSFTSGDVSGKALGNIMLVFSKDDFTETRDSSRNVNQENVELLKNGNGKKEIFCNGEPAYGICTGIGSTYIKCIVADKYIDKLGLEIAKNGFYIPIVDKSGKVIYTEKMYEDFREKMRGLSYYNGDEFILDETAKNEDIKQIAEKVDANIRNTQKKKNKIVKVFNGVSEEMGYSLSEKRITDLTPGIIELIDTGSTGRGTNEPGAGDFDFMLRMDRQLSNSPTELKNKLREALGNANELLETANGDFRYKGVTVEGLNNPIDIDITFAERTDEIEYTTDECIKERLRNIRNQNPEDYKYVLANILLAKNFLKLSGVYKKSNAAPPENGQPDTRGGLGAVGIENWILQNGGSFEAAAKSFIRVANECENLEEFKKKYAIWDFGENYMSANSNIYPHDNFVYNMDETGFKKMKIVLTKYLETMKNRKVEIEDKIGFEDLAGQVLEEIEDSEYMCTIRNLTEKMKGLQEPDI